MNASCAVQFKRRKLSKTARTAFDQWKEYLIATLGARSFFQLELLAECAFFVHVSKCSCSSVSRSIFSALTLQ